SAVARPTGDGRAGRRPMAVPRPHQHRAPHRHERATPMEPETPQLIARGPDRHNAPSELPTDPIPNRSAPMANATVSSLVRSFADVGFSGMRLLTAVGLMVLPFGTQNLTNRLRSALDGLMIASSTAMVSWILVLRPLAHATTGTSAFLSMWYPMGDVVLVTI